MKMWIWKIWCTKKGTECSRIRGEDYYVRCSSIRKGVRKRKIRKDAPKVEGRRVDRKGSNVGRKRSVWSGWERPGTGTLTY